MSEQTQTPVEPPSLSGEEQALREQLTDAERELSGLQDKLGAIDAELESLASRSEQYGQLEHICSLLESLAEQGVADLFWGEHAGPTADGYLRDVHERIGHHREQIRQVQERRSAAFDEVDSQCDVIDFLDDDLYQTQQAEERRRQEWLIERETSEDADRRLAMPWMRGFEDDSLFRKSLGSSALVALLLGLLLPMIDLPIPDLDELTDVPERVAQFIRKEQYVPPPPSAAVREQQPDPEPPEQESEPDEPPEPTPQVAAETNDTEPRPESAAEKVKSTGILAFRERFSNLSNDDPAARLGSQARVSNRGEAAVGRPTRAMVTSQGSGSSGGINLASLSRDVVDGSGGELAKGVQLSRVESSIEGGGPGDRPMSAGAAAGRTDEEIQIVFDRYKAALYRLYNRELRKDPTLRGQMVLRLTIEPDGSVSLCAVQASDMKAPGLAQQVVSSVSAFQFGAKDVPPVTILYPIDFLPTA